MKKKESQNLNSKGQIYKLLKYLCYLNLNDPFPEPKEYKFKDFV